MNPVFKSRPNELITTTDGRKLYHSRSVAVVGIVGMYANGVPHFIIEKRGTAPGLDKQGLWCLPCGYLDWDESGPSAFRRELWEKVGIDLHDYMGYCHSPNYTQQPWYVKTEPDENRQNVTLRYGVVWRDLRNFPILKPNNACEHPNEVADAIWMPSHDITKYQFAFNHDSVIRDFISTRM